MPVETAALTSDELLTEAERVVWQIESGGGEVWFTDPPDLGETDASPPKPTPEQFARSATSVQGISFDPSTSTELRGLGEFSNLRALMLGGDVINDDALAELPIVESLESLTIISSDTFTGAGLEHLVRQPRLKDLEIVFTDGLVSDRFHHLSKLARLQSLSIIRAPLDDEILRHVGSVHSLERLALGDWGASKPNRCTTLKELASLTRLKRLELYAFQVPSTEYAHIGRLGELEELRVEGDSRLGDVALEEFGKLTKLTFLSVHGPRITDEGLRPLSKLHNLEVLFIQWALIEGDGLVHLHNLTNLRAAILPGSSEAKEALRRALPNCELH